VEADMQIKLSQRDIDKLKSGETLIETEELIITVNKGKLYVWDKINQCKCQVMNVPKLNG